MDGVLQRRVEREEGAHYILCIVSPRAGVSLDHVEIVQPAHVVPPFYTDARLYVHVCHAALAHLGGIDRFIVAESLRSSFGH